MARRRAGLSAIAFWASFSNPIGASDLGVRPGVASALGFEDAPKAKPSPSHNADACTVFGCPDCLLDQGVV